MRKFIIWTTVYVIFFAHSLTAMADDKKESEQTEKTITVSLAGDCTLGYDVTRGYGASFTDVFYKNKSSYGYFFENVLPVFTADDLTVVNLEGPLTNAATRAEKEFSFIGRPEFANILKAGSIEAVNLANNHTYDYLQQGFDDTKKNLTEAKIAYFGAGNDCITEAQGVKIGILGYKGWSNGKAVKTQISTDIERIKGLGAQIVLVSFHWGEERSNEPNTVQKDLGRHAIDSGADLVFGHHPHVIQGIEQYNGKYIVYSLGNFSFGGNRNPKDKDTFIFQQSFKFVNGIKTENAIKIIPASVSSVKERNDFRPTPAAGKDAERILNRLAAYSKALNKNDISGVIMPSITAD